MPDRRSLPGTAESLRIRNEERTPEEGPTPHCIFDLCGYSTVSGTTYSAVMVSEAWFSPVSAA